MSPLIRTCKMRLVAGCIAVLLGFARECSAQSIKIIPIERTAFSSGTVVLARLDKFVPDPAAPSTLPTRPMPGMSRAELTALAERRSIRREPGVNSFELIARLKGESATHIELHTDALSVWYYGSDEFQVPDQCVCLLLLNPAGDGWAATESSLPFVPLGVGFRLPENVDPNSPDLLNSIVHILIASLDDQQVRTSSLLFLSTIRDKSVAAAAQRIWDDPAASVFAKRNAMECLAENQVVEMIPSIAGFTAAPGMQGTGYTALQRYRTREAIVPLTQCLTAGNQMAQTNARIALENIAKAQNIGFLVRSLRLSKDPYLDFFDLHRLVPALGTPRGRAYLEEHKEQEIQADERWWKREQQMFGQPAAGPDGAGSAK